MSILAIDPGTRESGWALLERDRVHEHGTWQNERLVERVALRARAGAGRLVVEQPMAYGARTLGSDILTTAWWAGRFCEAWIRAADGRGPPPAALPFPKVAHALLGRAGGVRESDVWTAVCDRFGGETASCGARRCPRCKGKGWFGRGRPRCSDCDGDGFASPAGPLSGVRGHARSAVAVGLAALVLEGVDVGVNPGGEPG